jgi:pimeloyl-ACP methyl ester carboxylesterase
MQTYKSLFLMIMMAMIISSCQTPLTVDKWQAYSFQKEIITTSDFTILIAHKNLKPNQNALLYIEGDGQAWLSRRIRASDPTPRQSLVQDMVINQTDRPVLYMARPCQFIKTFEKPCHPSYWDRKRFAPNVISSMNEALEFLKQHYRIRGFDVVGYSGGGAIALLLAQQRTDIHSITTIAGHLDTLSVSQYHGLSPLDGSLNPADKAFLTAHIPQTHYVGDRDQIIPPVMIRNYIQALPKGHKARIMTVPDATHDDGWDNIKLQSSEMTHDDNR